MNDKIIGTICVIVLLLGVAYSTSTLEKPQTDAEIILSATQDWLVSPKVTLTAKDLYTNINDGNAANDPYILDIRGATDYQISHISGAVNIPYATVFTSENLEKLPTDKQIVVVCYTGHTASQTTALLGAGGYDAIALKWGFESWTDGGKAFTGSAGYDSYLVTGTEPGTMPAGTRCGGDEPPADDVPADDAPAGDGSGNLLLNAANNYLALAKPPTVAATDIYGKLSDADASNDPFLLDIRGAEDYAAGHIPTAVNVPFKEVFLKDNIKKLPDDEQIVVVCYTGHTASQITALLNVNGYNGIALKFGFESWADGGKAFNPATDRMNYPVESGLLVRSFADDYMASGKAPTIEATALHDNLADGNTANDPFVLDIRGATDYATGHIPTAVNVPFRDVFKPENLPKLPTDRQIVVVCYTGHTASQTTALLNVAEYDAVTLKFGFEGWASGGMAFNATKDRVNGATVTVASTATAVTPTLVYSSQMAVTANDYMAANKAPTMAASVLQTNLGDGNASNDPFILDIRSAADYAAGHISGAVNIAFRDVFKDANFALLPTDIQIVVVCYTGHTASQTTALLGICGYNSVTLKFGFESWSDGGKAFVSSAGYDADLVTGSEPGVWS
ncbi:MAG: rhodanese-like domain-containing protein [Thermoplasmata archaeon]